MDISKAYNKPKRIEFLIYIYFIFYEINNIEINIKHEEIDR